MWESLNPSAGGDKPSHPGEKPEGKEKAPMEQALGGQVGIGPAQPGEVQGPVVVVVAGGGPIGGTVDLVIRNGHASGSSLAQNNVLTANHGCLSEQI